MKPDFVIARRHIELLTGSAATPMHWRFVNYKTKETATTCGSVDKVLGEVIHFQNRGMCAFCAINPGGLEDKDITHIRASFVDGDGIPLPDVWHAEPDFLVIRDALHWHAYWRVAPGSLSVAEFKGAQQRLAAHYRTDSKICNPARIMRLAGSVHQKGAPVRVTLKELRAGPPRPATELLSGLVANITTGSATVSGGDYTGEMDLPCNIKLGERLARDREPAIQGEPGILRHGDEATMGMAADLHKLALTEPVIFDIMAEHFNPRCVPEWDLEDGGSDNLRSKVQAGIARCTAAGQVGLWARDGIPMAERMKEALAALPKNTLDEIIVPASSGRLSIGSQTGPRIGGQKGPFFDASKGASTRPGGAGRGCAAGASIVL